MAYKDALGSDIGFTLRTNDSMVHHWMGDYPRLPLRGCWGIKAPGVSRLEAGRKGGESQ